MNIRKKLLAISAGVLLAAGSLITPISAMSRSFSPYKQPTIGDIGMGILVEGMYTFAVQTVVSACWGILGTSFTLAARAVCGPSKAEIMQQKEGALQLTAHTIQLLKIKLQSIDPNSLEYADVAKKLAAAQELQNNIIDDLVEFEAQAIQSIDSQKWMPYRLF